MRLTWLFSGSIVGALALAAGLAGTVATKPAAAPAPRARALFPMVEDERWGFIDSAGTVLIAPRFAQVQAFSDGRSAARENGRYGYLTPAGGWALPPAYDYASAFRRGLAVVETDSLSQLIDPAGRPVALPGRYRSLAWLSGRGGAGLWVATLANHDLQLLDAHGHLLTATHLARVGELSSNRIVVHRQITRVAHGDTLHREQTAVLDGHGRLVVPFGRFDRVSTFWGNLATADLAQGEHDETPPRLCLLDSTGRIVARLPRTQEFIYEEEAEISEGIVPVRLGRAGRAPTLDHTDLGALDRRGRLLFRRADLLTLRPFHQGRTWAENSRHAWLLLNTAGQRVGKVAVSRPLGAANSANSPRATGVEVVELADGAGYAALDRDGHVVRQLATPKFDFNDPRLVGGLLVFPAADTTGRLGFWDWRSGLLLPPRFNEISADGYQHGLLAVVEDGRLGYLAANGRYVWRAAPPRASHPLNLDYMRRAHYSVASVPLPRYAGFGGWAASANQAQSGSEQPPVPPALSLNVTAQAEAHALDPTHDGHRVSLTNTTADTVVFDAQDSGLYLTVQAQDARGRWCAIEYTPRSWCGNSYHQVFLAPGQRWQLTVPTYAGEQGTQLRLCLRVQAEGRQPGRVLYSNVFAGGVNPGQFWRRAGYSPQDLMDPYAE